MSNCKFCNGAVHPVESCPLVKIVEYSNQGDIIRVEKFAPRDYYFPTSGPSTTTTPLHPVIYSTPGRALS